MVGVLVDAGNHLINRKLEMAFKTKCAEQQLISVERMKVQSPTWNTGNVHTLSPVRGLK